MCTLRAGSAEFDVDRFLKGCSWKPSAVFHRGQLRGKRVIEEDAFNVTVSQASWTDLPTQVQEAARFVQKNRASLRRLKKYVGAGNIVLDFPTESRLSSDICAYEERFPASFIALAGKAGLAITLSIYPRSKRSATVRKRNRKSNV